MKKVIGVLAVLAFVGSVANAELLKNFKYDGKIEVNAYNTNNTTDFNKKNDDKAGKTDTRVQVNSMFDLNDDVNAVVSIVKSNRQYGQGSENATALEANVYVEQAYLNLKGVLGLDHKLGRQYYGEQGDLVAYFGPRGWPYTSNMSNPGVATTLGLDGWTGYYKNWGVDFTGLIANQKQQGAGTQDIRINGITASGKVADVALNGYVYNKNDKTGGTSNYLDVLGLKAKYAIPQVKNLNVAGEYAMNMGKDLNKPAIGYKHQGYAYKFNADYGMDLAGKFGINGEYYFASGDEKNNTADTAFQAIASDYRPGIINGGGFATVPVGSGGTVMNLGANWTPSKLEKLNIAANYYDFSADKKVALAKKHVGTEYDLVATWTHSANVDVKGYYAMYQNEKKNKATDDAANMMGAAVCVKF